MKLVAMNSQVLSKYLIYLQNNFPSRKCVVNGVRYDIHKCNQNINVVINLGRQRIKRFAKFVLPKKDCLF